MANEPVELGASRKVSMRFRRRTDWLLDSGDPWEGPDSLAIGGKTAALATHVAELAPPVAPEPFATPAGDGWLMLEWRLPNGKLAGVFIRADDDEITEEWKSARIYGEPEQEVQSAAEFVALLRRAAAAPPDRSRRQ